MSEWSIQQVQTVIFLKQEPNVFVRLCCKKKVSMTTEKPGKHQDVCCNLTFVILLL